MKNELERLQFVTRNYALLQGYPIGLAGVLYILFGFAEMIWKKRAAIVIHGWLFPVALAVMVFAILAVHRHYVPRYGVVKSPIEPRRLTYALLFLGCYFILVQLAGPDFRNLKISLDPTCLNGGLVLILCGLLPGFPWRHYVPVGVVLAAIGFFPAFHIMTVQQFWHGWSFIAPGVAFLVGGVIDRLIFLHMLPEPQTQESHA